MERFLLFCCISCLFVMVNAGTPDSVCTKHTNCGAFNCTVKEALTNTLLAYLGGSDDSYLKRKMKEAEEIMYKYPGVLFVDIPLIIHTSLDYLCCLTPLQGESIISALKDWKWSAFNVTFEKV